MLPEQDLPRDIGFETRHQQKLEGLSCGCWDTVREASKAGLGAREKDAPACYVGHRLGNTECRNCT